MKKKKFFEKISNIYNIMGVLILTLGFILILIPTGPYIWYLINPQATQTEINSLSAEIIPEKESIQIEDGKTQGDSLPEVDKTLPKDNFVLIDSIDVYSPLHSGDDFIEALNRGTWIVPEFGDPINDDRPIILASHRFGYSSWTKETRNKISFYNLPKTEVGDKIEIIWNQMLFEYEIYKTEESNYITDYNADLILYTCKFFNSPIRIFRYANMIY
jgi:sortase (surface protein transpeptidase)